MKLRQFIEHERVDIHNVKSAYSFRGDLPKWNQWLQRPALWLLRKLGAYHQLHETVRTHTLPDGPILHQIVETVERISPEVAKNNYIVIGAETYQELVSDENIRSSFAFTEDLMFNRHIFGVGILVVPHVEGWAIVPKKPDIVMN